MGRQEKKWSIEQNNPTFSVKIEMIWLKFTLCKDLGTGEDSDAGKSGRKKKKINNG